MQEPQLHRKRDVCINLHNAFLQQLVATELDIIMFEKQSIIAPDDQVQANIINLRNKALGVREVLGVLNEWLKDSMKLEEKN